MKKQFGTIAKIFRFAEWSTEAAVLFLFLAGTLLSACPAGAQDKKDTRRAFYLTTSAYDGSQALNACAPGYHMASMWELLNPSSLRYETTLGLTREDSGFGPPQVVGGWVRTGGIPRASVSVAGANNCRAYTSNTPGDLGTAVILPLSWELQTSSSPIAPWQAGHAPCESQATRVWCAQD